MDKCLLGPLRLQLSACLHLCCCWRGHFLRFLNSSIQLVVYVYKQQHLTKLNQHKMHHCYTTPIHLLWSHRLKGSPQKVAQQEQTGTRSCSMVFSRKLQINMEGLLYQCVLKVCISLMIQLIINDLIHILSDNVVLLDTMRQWYNTMFILK